MADMAGRSLTDEERRTLLAELSEIPVDADADAEVIHTFLPSSVYQHALGKRVLVIRGERGAGKTALFMLIRAAGKSGIPLGELIEGAPEGTMIEGFSEAGTNHPPSDMVERFATTAPQEALRAFWLGHLAGRLARDMYPKVELPPAFASAYTEHRTDLERWVPVAQAALPELYAWLDRVDGAATTTCFVLYDHLDRIAANQGEVRTKLVIALVGLWMSLSQRYERVRGKILLREDLFQGVLTSFADATKLEARSVRLEWTAGKLYALLVRRMAQSPKLGEWLKEVAGVPLTEHKRLGWVPKSDFDEGDQRRFAMQLVGQYMGAGPTKGVSYRWIITHLQDAHLRVTPRSVLELVRGAAETALKRGPKATYRKLLDPTELQMSLEMASRRRVNELKEDYSVVESLESLRDQNLFLTKSEVIAALRKWSRAAESRLPPSDVFDELMRLGVLSDRGGDRIDIPDVFRYAFGIKRKGGVRRVA
ncbi:MAG: hypothetical protein U0271_31855 [Polyangiaceae bacterium]